MKAATEMVAGELRWKHISIHAAREGGDFSDELYDCGYVISIHAAREGGDEHLYQVFFAISDFNPRRP